jgi:CBS domain-containing protein
VPHRRFEAVLGESTQTQLLEQKLGAITAGGAMSSPAITIRPARPVAEAAATMARRGINRIPVVDEGRLLGIITRADIVKASVRSDEEIARTIREEILLRTLLVDPAAFDVSVTNGIATVSGVADRRSTAELIRHLVRLVPGVFDLRGRVDWTLDDAEIRPSERDPAFPYSP